MTECFHTCSVRNQETYGGLIVFINQIVYSEQLMLP